MKRYACFLSLLLVLLLASVGSSAEVTLRLGHSSAKGTQYDVYCHEFKKAVERISNGRVRCDVYSDKQLGADREAIESVGMGMHEMCVTASSPISNYVPDFLIFDLPFVITDRDKAAVFLDGPVAASLLKKLEPKGIIGLGYAENGFRHISNNKKPVVHPDDLKGMKVRTMESPLHIETFRFFGALPSPMSSSEIFIAMQQGAVDAQENPLVILLKSRYIEVSKFVSLTGHFYTPCLMLISKQHFDSYPKDIQGFIVQAEKEARVAQRKFCVDVDKTSLDEIKSKYPSVKINTVDAKEWRAACEPLYPQLRKILIEKKVDIKLFDALLQSQK